MGNQWQGKNSSYCQPSCLLNLPFLFLVLSLLAPIPFILLPSPSLLSCQQCNGCSRYFCQQCISLSHSGGGGGGDGGARGAGGWGEGVFGAAVHGKKSPQLCRRCIVFGYHVMERRHLNELSIQELKGYKVGIHLGGCFFLLVNFITTCLSAMVLLRAWLPWNLTYTTFLLYMQFKKL